MPRLAPARGVRSLFSAHRHTGHRRSIPSSRRRFSSQAAAQFNPDPGHTGRKRSEEERLAEREFLFSLLQNSPSKRDARAYLSRFALPEKANKNEQKKRSAATPASLPDPEAEGTNAHLLRKTGVNLGSLYAPGKAIEESPVFIQLPLSDTELPQKHTQTLHVALVKIRLPQTLDAHTLSGIGLTLGQLVRLGLNIAVVVDCEEDVSGGDTTRAGKTWREETYTQVDRIIAAIAEHNKPGAMMVADALQLTAPEGAALHRHPAGDLVRVHKRELLQPLLERGVVTVLPPIASSADLTRLQRVAPDDVVLALSREFAGLNARVGERHKQSQAEASTSLGGWSPPSAQSTADVSLDRIIVLDPLGGIPSKERSDSAHIFINLEQEYNIISAELAVEDAERTAGAVADAHTAEPPPSVLSGSNPLSRFIEQEVASLQGSREEPPAATTLTAKSSRHKRHMKNLDLIRSALQLLPAASSALIITPASAAISSQQPRSAPAATAGVRTRLTKNPLIHNLLTDKPMVSSSLPLSRFATPTFSPSTPPPTSPTTRTPLSPHPTFLKKGIPLLIVPDPRAQPWLPPSPISPLAAGLSLTDDPRIDLPRLLHLIEDSFGRRLDTEHYLARTRGRLAGVIVAGGYEGGAICTWEAPPHRPGRPPVPYLDKFAVLRASQGQGGVADIVFKALLRACFPGGCVWRSRSGNPVNRWYAERSRGVWRMPGGKWTLFWTGEEGGAGEGSGGGGGGGGGSGVGVGIGDHREGGEEARERWLDFVDVCANVEPSWADGRPPD